MCKRLKIKIIFFLVLMVSSHSFYAQLPAIHFQTIYRNVQWTADSLVCRVRLFENEDAAQPEYMERHVVPLYGNQYLSFLIGQGVPELGNWSELVWDNPSKKVEIDIWQGGQWVNWVSQAFPFVPKAQTVLGGWQGPIGEVGPTGTQGTIGAQGLIGSQGVQGLSGLTGFEVDSTTSSGVGNFIQWLSDGTTREWSFPNWPLGCMDTDACNYTSNALINDGSCLYAQSACDDGDAQTMSDALDAFCQCVGTYALEGCTDPSACNFLIGSNVDDGSCRYLGANCNHPDSFIENEVIDASCECNGVWRSYDIQRGNGYNHEYFVWKRCTVDQWYNGSLNRVRDDIPIGSVVINGLEWMTLNFVTDRYNNNELIDTSMMDCSISGFEIECSGLGYYGGYTACLNCYTEFGYENDARTFLKYRYEVVSSDSLCPSGWRVANDLDWQGLVDFFGGSEFASRRLGVFGGGNLPGWYSPFYWYWWSEQEIFSSDFSGLKILADDIDTFDTYLQASWWSPSDDAPPGKMWIRKVVSNSPKVYRYLVDANEYHSVRCVKNP
jgi:uncharacterized protein (TIGR02145 family)